MWQPFKASLFSPHAWNFHCIWPNTATHDWAQDFRCNVTSQVREDANSSLVKPLEYFQSRIIPAVWFWAIIDVSEEQWQFKQYKPICFQVGDGQVFVVVFFLTVEEHRNMDHVAAGCCGNHQITFSKTFLFNYIHHWQSSGVNFSFSLKLQSAKGKEASSLQF